MKFKNVFICIGAVYRYYESRRRSINDSKPERYVQVSKNKESTRKYGKKKRVITTNGNKASYMINLWIFIGSHTTKKVFKKD